jgi:hypothetical protein
MPTPAPFTGRPVSLRGGVDVRWGPLGRPSPVPLFVILLISTFHRTLIGLDNANEQNTQDIKIPNEADKSAVGTIMQIEYFMRTFDHPSQADKSAVGTINRPLQGAEVV